MLLGLLLKEIFRLQRRFQISAIESIDFFGRTGSDRRGFHRHFSSGIRAFSASALPEAHVSRRRPARARRPLAVGDDARRLLGGRDGEVVRAGTSESLSRAMRARGGVRRRLRPERRRVGRVAFRRHLRRGEPAPLGDRRGRRRPAQLADVLDVRPRRGHRPGRAGRVDDRAPGRRHLRPRGGPYLSGNRRSPGESSTPSATPASSPPEAAEASSPSLASRSTDHAHPLASPPSPSTARRASRSATEPTSRRTPRTLAKTPETPSRARPPRVVSSGTVAAHPSSRHRPSPRRHPRASRPRYRRPRPSPRPPPGRLHLGRRRRRPRPSPRPRFPSSHARRPSHRHTPRRRDSRSSSPSSSP